MFSCSSAFTDDGSFCRQPTFEHGEERLCSHSSIALDEAIRLTGGGIECAGIHACFEVV